MANTQESDQLPQDDFTQIHDNPPLNLHYILSEEYQYDEPPVFPIYQTRPGIFTDSQRDTQQESPQYKSSELLYAATAEVQYLPKQFHRNPTLSQSSSSESSESDESTSDQEATELDMFMFRKRNYQKSLNKNNRLNFIRKVYSILLIQLSITSGMLLLILQFPILKENLLDYFATYFVAITVNIVITIILICNSDQLRKVPNNYGWIMLFTLFKAYQICGLCCFYDTQIILTTVVMATALCLVLTGYAWLTCQEFSTKVGGGLVVVFTVLITILAGIQLYESYYMTVVLSGIFVMVYGMYILIFTALISGKSKCKLSYDDYIIGAFTMFVDVNGLVIYMFNLLKRVKV